MRVLRDPRSKHLHPPSYILPSLDEAIKLDHDLDQDLGLDLGLDLDLGFDPKPARGAWIQDLDVVDLVDSIYLDRKTP